MAEDKRIVELERKLQAVRWNSEDVRRQMHVIAARHTLSIAEETTDRFGNLRYRNKDMRDAALTLALDGDEEYRALRARSRELELERAELTAELHQLRPPPRFIIGPMHG